MKFWTDQVPGPGTCQTDKDQHAYPAVDLVQTTLLLRLEGRSLTPLLNNPAAPWDKPALSVVARESWLGRSIHTERWCYTEWDEGRYGVELYDHQTDPREMKNLAPDSQHAATVAELREKLHQSPIARKSP